MSHVTLSAKRYSGPWVFACAGCDLLSLSDRSDTLTCSTACRVKAHRSGKLKALRARARYWGMIDQHTGKPNPRLLLQAEAIMRLRPDLVAEIDADRMTLTQAMPATCRAFAERLLTEAREHAISERLHDFTH